MEKPNWSKSIDQVLLTKSEKVELTSASGNKYITEVISAYDVVVLGSATAKTDAMVILLVMRMKFMILIMILAVLLLLLQIYFSLKV